MQHVHKLLATATAVALCVFSAALLGSVVAQAQDADGAPIHYHQFYGEGFASDAEVRRALGTLKFSMSDCHEEWLVPIRRYVWVTSTRSGNFDNRITETVLYRAAKYAWRECPLNFYFGAQLTKSPRYDITAVDLYLGDGTHAISATHMYGDIGMSVGGSYAWESVSDVAADERKQELADAQQNTVRRYDFTPSAQPSAPVAAQTQVTEDTEQQHQELARLAHTIWVIVQWLAAIFTLWVLIASRHALARWYYFYFYPHPAEPIVRAALKSGTVLDGKALANALSEIPPGSSTFRAVRLEQAEQLFHQMQDVSIAQLRRQEKQAPTRAREHLERAAFVSIQDAVSLAAVALDKAKALYSASQEIGVRQP